MDVYKLKELSPADRKAVFESEAVQVEMQTYNKPLSELEMTIMKDELSQIAIEKAIIDDEYRSMKAEFKERLEPLNKRFSENLFAIRTRSKATYTNLPTLRMP